MNEYIDVRLIISSPARLKNQYEIKPKKIFPVLNNLMSEILEMPILDKSLSLKFFNIIQSR